MEKQQLIKDWILFCQGNRNFEKGHFYSLLMDELSEDEIDIIYEPFINKKKLKLKLKKYLYSLESSINITSKKKNLLEVLIKLDFQERLSIFKEIAEFSQFRSNMKFEYVEEFNVVENLAFDDVLSQMFFNYTDFQIIEENDKVDALYDALYGLVADFDYRLYLFEPLLSVNYTGEYLFQFKKMGGVYAIKDETVMYSFR